MTILSAISSSSILPTRALHTTSLSHHQSLSNNFNRHENLHKLISYFRIKAAKLPPGTLYTGFQSSVLVAVELFFLGHSDPPDTMVAGNGLLLYPLLGFASCVAFIYMSLGDLRSQFQQPSMGFVERNGTQFIVDGKAYYVNGWNSYGLMYQAVEEFSRHRVRTMLQAGAKMGPLSVGHGLSMMELTMLFRSHLANLITTSSRK